MKKTIASSATPTFFAPNFKTEEVKQIQQRILRVKSAFLCDVGVIPTVMRMPLDDIDKIFLRCKQIEGHLFYSDMKIKEGECYQASYESPEHSNLPLKK